VAGIVVAVVIVAAEVGSSEVADIYDGGASDENVVVVAIIAGEESRATSVGVV
jgi:hypothetical protein